MKFTSKSIDQFTFIFFVCLSSPMAFAQSDYSYIYVGDSLAVGARELAFANNVSGVAEFLNKDFETAKNGKNPKWIYEQIRKVLNVDDSFFKYKTVILSSGYSNDPQGVYIDYHEKIIKSLLTSGAKVRMLGLANNFYINNKYGTYYYNPERYHFLKDLAKKYNIKIYPEFVGVDKIHMSHKTIKNIYYGIK